MLSELLLQHFKVLGVGPLLLDSIAPFSESGYTLVELLDVHQIRHDATWLGVFFGITTLVELFDYHRLTSRASRASGIWLGVSFDITTSTRGVNLNRLHWFGAHLTLFPNLVEDF